MPPLKEGACKGSTIIWTWVHLRFMLLGKNGPRSSGYESYEVPNYFNFTRGTDALPNWRFQYFRANSLGHSVPELGRKGIQDIYEPAPITFNATQETALVDLKKPYKKFVSQYTRLLKFDRINKKVSLTDTFVPLANQAVYWRMIFCNADKPGDDGMPYVDSGNSSIVHFVQGGSGWAKMDLKVKSMVSDPVNIEIFSAQPTEARNNLLSPAAQQENKPEVRNDNCWVVRLDRAGKTSQTSKFDIEFSFP